MHLPTELQEETGPVVSLTTGKRTSTTCLERDGTNMFSLNS